MGNRLLSNERGHGRWISGMDDTNKLSKISFDTEWDVA